MKSFFPFVLFLMIPWFLVAGCSPEGLRSGPPAAVVSTAPMLGQADTADAADRGCRVVLRQVGREWDPGQEAFETWCADGACTYVWRGSVDVADGIDGAVFALYRVGDGDTWYEVPALQVPARTPGYTHHVFVIAEHVFGPELDPEAAPSIELVPFVQLAGGGRLFDHNVHPGDLDNTRLEAVNGFMASAGYGVCQPQVGIVVFDPYWNVSEYGARRQGAFLRVDYALDRLPDCRGTHNGYPAWDLVAHARFSPGDVHVSASLRQPSAFFELQETMASFTFAIPADAQRVELWFENHTGAGSSCQAWDSNFGANYGFEIWPAADHPRCLDVERDNRRITNGDLRYVYNEPYCLGYDLAAEYDANHCEFHVDALGLAYEGHYGIPLRWMFAFVNVNGVDGTVENVGLLTRFYDEVAGADGVRFSLGRELEPGRWRVGFTYEKVVYQGSMTPAIRAQLRDFAFFLDVRRADGTVVRLWQSRNGQNFPFDDVLSHLAPSESIPYGNVRMATADALVYGARAACAR